MTNNTLTDELNFNFGLEAFFNARAMRAKILSDPSLQPDHFSFDRKLAEQVVREFQSTEPIFSETYSTFIEIFENIRASLSNCNLSSSQAETIGRSAVLIALRDGFTVYSHNPGQSLASNSEAFSALSVQNYRPFVGGDGNAYSADDMLEGLFDTLKAVLDYCGYLKRLPPISSVNNPDFRYLFELFNKFRVYKSDWYDCLLLGNNINATLSDLANNAVQIGRPIGILREFSLRTQQQSFSGDRSLALASHPFLEGKMVSSRKNRRDFAKYRTDMLKHVMYPYLRKIIDELDEDEELARTINSYLLLNFISLGNINKFAADPPPASYVFDATSLQNVAAKFLDAPVDSIARAMKRLEFCPGQKADIWFTPLVRYDDDYVLLTPMCAHANFERFAENIIANASGINTGKGFENYVADLTENGVRKAKLPFKVKRPFKAKGSGTSFEEIDLLILAGRSLFVGEVKYDAFPADEFSILQHASKMKSACEQAAVKAAFIEKNWPVIAGSISWVADIDNVVPFALTEKPFLNGLSYGGVPIICLRDFQDFFVGEVRSNVVFQNNRILSEGTVERTFSGAECAPFELQKYLHAPFRRSQFVAMLRGRKFIRPSNSLALREYGKLEFELHNEIAVTHS